MKILIVILILVAGCASDGEQHMESPEVEAGIKQHMARQDNGYHFESAVIVDTVREGELVKLEIADLKREIAVHNARINQERLIIDIHARSPNPNHYAEADKSSRENIEFYRNLNIDASKRIENLKPKRKSNKLLGFVVAHRYTSEAGHETIDRDKYLFISPDFNVLLMHREDRHDIRVAAFGL